MKNSKARGRRGQEEGRRWYAVFPFGGVAYGTQEARPLRRRAYRAGITWLSRQKMKLPWP